MRGGVLGFGLAAGVACGAQFPEREFDCGAITEAYVTRCGAHLGISSETVNCEAVWDGQNGPNAATIDRAAAVCEAALAGVESEVCGELFVCLDDEQGLSALARSVGYGGTAVVEGETFLFDGAARVWIGTTKDGEPGDLEALFETPGLVWYLRIDDFVARAGNPSFAAAIKLENSLDNLEVMGMVAVAEFAVDGQFDVGVVGEDPATGESLELFLIGAFTE